MRTKPLLAAVILALVAGLVMGTLRTLPDNPWLVRLANAWVELFRNIPLLVQIFLWYHVLPALFTPLRAVQGAACITPSSPRNVSQLPMLPPHGSPGRTFEPIEPTASSAAFSGVTKSAGWSSVRIASFQPSSVAGANTCSGKRSSPHVLPLASSYS